MAPTTLSILIVDQHPDAIGALRRAVKAFGDPEVVGDAGFGPIASTWAHTLEPAIIIVAVEEPTSRALSTIQALSRGNPRWTVVGIVNQFDREVFRRAVLAGARDVLLRNCSPRELHDSLVQAHDADALRIASSGQHQAEHTGSIISVFGVKGGVGKTTLATNLAVALAQETSTSIALVDLDVPFGDVPLMLDLEPQNIIDALGDAVLDDLERLQRMLVRTEHGVHVLSAPLAPSHAGSIDSSKVSRLLSRLAALHQFVVVDAPVGLTELTASIGQSTQPETPVSVSASVDAAVRVRNSARNEAMAELRSRVHEELIHELDPEQLGGDVSFASPARRAVEHAAGERLALAAPARSDRNGGDGQRLGPSVLRARR
ncbi:MAG: P-loop NTPase, partial [Chloroflexota bacterium]|nr:P-loop NTPase [Chloroflexota bacterium]